MIQSLRIGLERTLQRALRVTSILHARFSAPVHPGDTVLFQLHPFEDHNSQLCVKAVAKRGGKRIADFALELEPRETTE
jgi:3-hydroxymyristoyl/3-hydroxydecanoyl-(acyl carrier protein) dehydratase